MAFAMALLGLLPWLIYGHTLRFGTVLDDDTYVFNNPYLRDASSFLYLLDLKSFVHRCLQWGVSADIALNFITRPVTYLTFYFNHLVGGDDTTTYRLLNIAIHMGNGLLLFSLIRRLFQRDSFSLLAAATAGLLFVAHPLATESVTYITQRFESLATFFCLLALLLHVQARSASSVLQRRTLAAAAIVATALSMLSKETGVVTPVLMVLLDCLHFQDRLPVALRRAAGSLTLLPMVPLLIVSAHWAQETAPLTVSSLLNITNHGIHPYPLSDYLLTQVCAWISYLRLLVLPIGQNFDHAYPLITSPLDSRFIMAILFTVSLIAGAWLNFRRQSKKSGAIVLFGMLWYFISLLPSSSIIPLPDLFAEHRCYLPSVGLFLVFAVGLHRLLNFSSALLEGRVILYSLSSLAILTLSRSTLLRNEVLQNRESLWKDALAKGSNTVRVWKGLGIVNFNSGRIDESARCFERALEVAPDDDEAWLNLCTLYIKTMQTDKALEATERGLRSKPRAVQIMHLRGLALVMAGRVPEGLQHWELILQHYPHFRSAHLSMAEVLAQIGHEERAIHHLRVAEQSGRLDPLYDSLKKKLQSHLSAMR
jgi:tetratricopeptide (TPR) repeat protein